MKEGKKGTYNPYKDLPINSKDKCDECNGDLIKLETILGETTTEGKYLYKDMYWVCVCSECGRYTRVFDHKVKIGDYIVNNNLKYRAKGETSGR